MTPRELAVDLIRVNEGRTDEPYLVCSWCSPDALAAPLAGLGGVNVDLVVEVIEHAAFGHSGRSDLLVQSVQRAASGLELGVLLDLPPQNEYDAKWRAQQKLEAIATRISSTPVKRGGMLWDGTAY
jgi:hypothetical protein